MVPPLAHNNMMTKDMFNRSVVFMEEITDKSRSYPKTSLRTSRNAINREIIKIFNQVNICPINRMSGITVIDENMKGIFTVPQTKDSLCVS
jgi:hypothetical protein